MYKNCVTRPRGGKNPGKHQKSTVFNPTPGPPRRQVDKPWRGVNPNNEAVLAQASHRISLIIIHSLVTRTGQKTELL